MEADSLIEQLRQTLGPAAVVSEPDALATYDQDASMLVAHAPQVVVLPASSAQAATAVALALQAGLPVVARGAGTGIAGGAVPLAGGMLLSTARMDKIEAIEPRSRRARVGAGVVNADLNARLAPLGLQFAPDPSSQRASTIGGNLATNAGGPHCLKYGVTTNHVLAVELVRPDGSLLWTGDGIDEWAGYDLTGLVVGSEGTFGVVTQALVRLTPLPEAVRVVLALFPSVVAASSAVSRVIAAGLLPTSLEVMDHNAIRAVNGAYGLGLPEATGTTLLIIEVDGVADGIDAILAQILDLCRNEGAFELRPARDPAEQARVWAARKSVAGAIGRLAPAYLLVDTVVPRTRLPLMMEHVEQLRHEYAMEVCNVFHAGDGNLHPLVLYDPRDPDQTRRAHALASAVLKLSIAQGGVISGEHGIGLEKRDYLPLLFSPAELALHAAIQHVFNPNGQFNPGKIFPAAVNPAALAGERRARISSSAAATPATPPLSATLTASLVELVGPTHVKPTVNGLFITPATIDELAQVMAVAHHAGLTVIPTGTASPPPRPTTTDETAVTLHLSTCRLTRVLVYEPDDLTIWVEAGMSLAELQDCLAANGQFLPLVVDEAGQTTLGGLVAAAVDGPQRLGYGTLRDWVLALTVVEADGTVVRLGAQVVKNVTGYDLVKLFVGSHGTLGLIAAVSLRVFPRPPASATMALAWPNRAAAFALLDDLAASRLLPTACEYLEGLSLPELGEVPGPMLCVHAEGHPAAVARHMHELRTLGARHGVVAMAELADSAEAALWQRIATLSAPQVSAGQALIRLCTAPADLGRALDDAAGLAAACNLTLILDARALHGVAYLRPCGSPQDLATFHKVLSERWQHTQILATDSDQQRAMPKWPSAPASGLMHALKTELDPFGRLNPGAYP